MGQFLLLAALFCLHLLSWHQIHFWLFSFFLFQSVCQQNFEWLHSQVSMDLWSHHIRLGHHPQGSHTGSLWPLLFSWCFSWVVDATECSERGLRSDWLGDFGNSCLRYGVELVHYDCFGYCIIIQWLYTAESYIHTRSMCVEINYIIIMILILHCLFTIFCFIF